jgi:hypothetical protein
LISTFLFQNIYCCSMHLLLTYTEYRLWDNMIA